MTHYKGYTCLHLAVITDKMEIARKLLEQYNACPDLHDHMTRSALHYCKQAAMFNLLLQEGNAIFVCPLNHLFSFIQ